MAGNSQAIQQLTAIYDSDPSYAQKMTLQQFIASNLRAAGSSSSTTPVQHVIMGTTPPTTSGEYTTIPTPGQVASLPTDTTTKGGRTKLTVDKAIAQFYTWDPATLAANIARMNQLGATVTTPADALAVWKQMVGYAADTLAAKETGVKGVNVMNPWQALAFMTGSSTGTGATPTSTTSTNTTNYSASQVENMGQAAYQSQLGRDPNQKELNSLPASTTTTTTNSKNKSVTQSGADVQQLMVDAARRDPNYAEHQAATTYMDALTGAIASGM